MKKRFNQLFLLTIFVLPVICQAQSKSVTKIKTIKKTTSTSTGTSNVKASIERGKLVYTARCLTCHQVDGSGVPSLNPPLIKTKWVLGDKAVLINQVLKGSKNKIEIDGETFHNVMPSLAVLTDQEIADVITYVRNSFGNKASAVSVTQVKLFRSKLSK
jgi:mono/diheme cytochrome c family protein